MSGDAAVTALALALRGQALAYVAAHPGVTARVTARGISVSTNAARALLTVLENDGEIRRCRQAGGKPRWVQSEGPASPESAGPCLSVHLRALRGVPGEDMSAVVPGEGSTPRTEPSIHGTWER